MAGQSSQENPKEDSEWEHKSPGFLGQWQCCSGHLVVPKHPNLKYWPITGATPTPPPTPGFRSCTANALQATPRMGSGGTTPRGILHYRNAKIVERYHKYTHKLPPLRAGDTVAIQSPLNHRWNTTEEINTTLPNRQYRIRVDGPGRITLRNRHFLRKCELKHQPQ